MVEALSGSPYLSADMSMVAGRDGDRACCYSTETEVYKVPSEKYDVLVPNIGKAFIEVKSAGEDLGLEDL